MMMKPQAFKLLRDPETNTEVKADTIVYDLLRHDYGLASDDTRITAIPHRSVTLARSGYGYGFTVAEADLEKIATPALPALTKEHIETVCMPGNAKTCRYLAFNPQGFLCAKHESVAETIDAKVAAGTMTAQADNCEGREGNAG